MMGVNDTCGAESLLELRLGESAEVLGLVAEGSLRRRLLDLGFVVGSRISVVRKSPFGDPQAYRLLGATYALRDSEAGLVRVRRLGRDAT